MGSIENGCRQVLPAAPHDDRWLSSPYPLPVTSNLSFDDICSSRSTVLFTCLHTGLEFHELFDALLLMIDAHCTEKSKGLQTRIASSNVDTSLSSPASFPSCDQGLCIILSETLTHPFFSGGLLGS